MLYPYGLRKKDQYHNWKIFCTIYSALTFRQIIIWYSGENNLQGRWIYKCCSSRDTKKKVLIFCFLYRVKSVMWTGGNTLYLLKVAENDLEWMYHDLVVSEELNQYKFRTYSHENLCWKFLNIKSNILISNISCHSYNT